MSHLVRYSIGVPRRRTMQTVQLGDNVRYVSMEDEEGVLGLFIHHQGEEVIETYQVNSREEFVEAYNLLCN